MIIESSHVVMTSHRTYDRTSSVSTSLSLSANGFSNNSNTQITTRYHEGDAPNEEHTDSKKESNSSLLNEFKQAQSIQRPVSLSRVPTNLDTIKAESLNYLMRLLFGIEKLEPASLPQDFNRQSLNGFGGNYTEYSYYEEEESTSFSTVGTVKTADGREIEFNLSLTMSRSFKEAYSKNITFGNPALCDPLVINLNTTSAHVTDQKFYFDLDADGTLDSISHLSAGSGFLALDKNNDGIISDGSELFGVHSGDGFLDLAAYDEDGNNWIDERDSIFDRLRIWTKDASGKDVLCAIGKAGVGAIYLGNAQTDFSLNSQKDNTTNARIRKTGIFLYENGACGTVQHLDMAM